jgi:hypothetical protein
VAPAALVHCYQALDSQGQLMLQQGMQQLLAILSRRCFCVRHCQSRQAMQHSKGTPLHLMVMVGQASMLVFRQLGLHRQCLRQLQQATAGRMHPHCPHSLVL